MATETSLKKEQDISIFEYTSALQELNKISKEEKSKLDHQIVLAKNNLRLLREEHIRLQGEFNQWKMGEEQKFKNELSKRHNQLIDQENKMNLLHKDLEQRSADLSVKEQRYLSVEKDRNEIGNARVEIEKIRTNASTLMAEADRKISEANSLMANANTRIEQSNKLDNKNSIRNQELCAREDKLVFDLKNIEMERNHLIELKEFVDPKILEIKELEIQISRDKKEIQDKHQDIINKSEENKITLKALEDKKEKLDRQELELRSGQDELKRKIIMADSKK